MKCNETREVMPDLAAGLTAVTPEVKAHLDSCAECAGKLEAFRQTMSLLDEWQALRQAARRRGLAPQTAERVPVAAQRVPRGRDDGGRRGR